MSPFGRDWMGNQLSGKTVWAEPLGQSPWCSGHHSSHLLRSLCIYMDWASTSFEDWNYGFLHAFFFFDRNNWTNECFGFEEWTKSSLSRQCGKMGYFVMFTRNEMTSRNSARTSPQRIFKSQMQLAGPIAIKLSLEKHNKSANQPKINVKLLITP